MCCWFRWRRMYNVCLPWIFYDGVCRFHFIGTLMKSLFIPFIVMLNQSESSRMICESVFILKFKNSFLLLPMMSRCSHFWFWLLKILWLSRILRSLYCTIFEGVQRLKLLVIYVFLFWSFPGPFPAHGVFFCPVRKGRVM